MACTRIRRQDGFIRGLLWVALIVALGTIVVLDGLSLFNARRSVEESAREAAREAWNTYSQTQNTDSAMQAAEKYLAKGDNVLTEFDVGRDSDGVVVFTVSATKHAETYGAKYLRYVGLGGWIERVSNPAATETSS